MFVFADRLGLVFVSNLPLLYLMAAKNCPVKLLTGWSYKQLNVLHRAVGRYNLLSFRQFVSTPVIFLGLLAWVSYLLINVTSKEEFRNAFYEVFLFVHVLLQTFALIFLYFHHKGSRPYVLVCIFIFVTDRIVLRLTIRSTRATGTVTILPDKKTVRVTLPSTPGNSLQFLIRARDGFSKKLLEAAGSGSSEFTAIVDGPYGSCFVYESLWDSDVALLVAGGSGIVVIYPLVHELATTITSTGDEEHGTGLTRGNDAPKRIVMVWVVREECQLSWLHGGELVDLRKLGVEIVTHVTQGNVLVGKRPKMGDVVEDVGSDLRSSGRGCDSRSDGGRGCGSMGVVVCGPSDMVRDTRNSCAGMMRRGLDVRIVTEKFGWYSLLPSLNEYYHLTNRDSKYGKKLSSNSQATRSPVLLISIGPKSPVRQLAVFVKRR
ncbi:hypothetical protein P167DRAFT_549291 [Morchella conica CCBAS932]|uniref:Uncharacterized protein n=1 Tax=Morchella conica CCBAS932 TaxID=1392247 RepID=A0A3N4KF87_9PEZI|nr:hypothetical protein P167DRAFT_549291 [Morchella conica CCBAS932]